MPYVWIVGALLAIPALWYVAVLVLTWLMQKSLEEDVWGQPK